MGRVKVLAQYSCVWVPLTKIEEKMIEKFNKPWIILEEKLGASKITPKEGDTTNWRWVENFQILERIEL